MHALELVLDGGEQPDPQEALATLAGQFRCAPAGRARSVRRLWLDTFDWRLHRAGLVLEQASCAGTSEIVLAGPDGDRLSEPAGRVRWPAVTGALAPGAVRDRLAPVTGIRALLPLAQARSSVRDLRVLNDDSKTVAWLRVDQTAVARPAAAQLPPRLVITPVRGYQAEAEQVARELAGLTGARPAAGTILAAVLAPAGQRPGDYSSKVDVSLTSSEPARLALAAVLLRLLDTLTANVEGTLRDLDPEFLHDLRVSVRRSRSALKLAGDVLPARLPRHFRPEFKWLGDLTTPTRDLDVYLLGFPAMTAGLTAATAADLEPLRAYLTRERARQHRRLAAGLRSARFTSLTAGWRSELSGLRAPARGPAVGGFAAARIGRAHRAVLSKGAAITPSSPPEALHDLRKRCKELRYLLEFFASLHDPGTHQRVLKDLKGLQDCLGEFQDAQVQQHELRGFAELMKPDVPAAALLAMGELAAQLAAGQQRARREFTGRFADFASGRARRRMRTLTSAAAT